SRRYACHGPRGGRGSWRSRWSREPFDQPRRFDGGAAGSIPDGETQPRLGPYRVMVKLAPVLRLVQVTPCAVEVHMKSPTAVVCSSGSYSSTVRSAAGGPAMSPVGHGYSAPSTLTWTTLPASSLSAQPSICGGW